MTGIASVKGIEELGRRLVPTAMLYATTLAAIFLFFACSMGVGVGLRAAGYAHLGPSVKFALMWGHGWGPHPWYETLAWAGGSATGGAAIVAPLFWRSRLSAVVSAVAVTVWLAFGALLYFGHLAGRV